MSYLIGDKLTGGYGGADICTTVQSLQRKAKSQLL